MRPTTSHSHWIRVLRTLALGLIPVLGAAAPARELAAGEEQVVREEEPAGVVVLHVVVHPDNPVSDISFATLAKMFKARKRHWPEGGSVYLVLPKAGSTEKKFLLEHVYRMKEKALKRYWVQLLYKNDISRRPDVFPSTTMILKVVGKRKGALAVVEINDPAQLKGVKVLTVDKKRAAAPDYALRARRKKD